MAPVFRIVSYNIRKSMGTDRRRDPQRILEVIGALRPDVALLQEADLWLFGRPSALPREEIEHRTGLTPLPVSRHDRSLGWHGNAIFARPEFRQVQVIQLDLPGLEPRGAVIADVDTGARNVRFVAAHLGLLRASRRSQLSALGTRLTSLPGMPTLIGGDFNEWSERVGLGRLARNYTVISPGKTFHVRRPVAALDRFAFSGEIEVRSSGVAIDRVTRLASDHFPIWGEFTVAG
jgi:endonuclease/exonuclease/phosphatase family metal-dependent hydrolase